MSDREEFEYETNQDGDFTLYRRVDNSVDARPPYHDCKNALVATNQIPSNKRFDSVERDLDFAVSLFFEDRGRKRGSYTAKRVGTEEGEIKRDVIVKDVLAERD